MTEFRINNKATIFLIVCSFFYIFPLVIANVYYIDDLARSLYGYGWKSDGRTFATLLMQFISGGEKISNLSPYTNMMAACILAFTGYYSCIITGIEKDYIFKLSSLIVLTSPFMLENLTYKYDSLPMSISIAAVSLPFLLSGWRFIIVSGIGVCVCLLTYQASLVVFFIMAGIVLSNSLIENKKTLTKIYCISSAIVFGGILTSLTNIIIPPEFAGRNKLIFSALNPISELKKNISNAIDYTSLAFSGGYFFVYIIIFLSFIISSLYILKHYHLKPRIIASLLITLLCCVSFPIINILLLNPWWTARIFIGFPFSIIALIAIIERVHPSANRYISFLLIIISLPLMASYSNALNAQNHYTDKIISRMFDGVDTEGKYILVNGTFPRSPEAKIAINNNPILKIMLPIYLSNGWSWGGHLLEKQGIIDGYKYLYTKESRERYIEKICDFTELKKSGNYILRTNGDIIIVDFKMTNC